MIIQGKDIKEKNILLKTKYCIIGSGAGGAVVAERLSKSGNDVILIEEGSHFSPGVLKHETETIAMGRIYRDAIMQATENNSITLFQGRAIGGSTFVNHALCFHMSSDVFDDWSHSNVIKNFNYNNLQDHYLKIEKFLKPKSTPPQYENSASKLFFNTFKKNNLKVSLTQRNTNSCVGCGSCFRSCDIGAKNSTDMTFIPAAIKNGAQVFSNFKADKILFKGDKAIGVEGIIISEFYKAKGSFKIEAENIIISAGALHSPWLLHRSGIKNKNIGQHLKIHPIVPMQARFKKNMDSFNGVPQSVVSQHYTDYHNKKTKGFIFYCDFSGYMGTSSHIPGIGIEFAQRLSQLRKMGQTQIMLLDSTTGTVNCKKEKPLISYDLNEMDKMTFVHAAKIMGKLYFDSGAEAIYLGNKEYNSAEDLHAIHATDFNPFSIHMYAAHFQSTCRMGTDPKQAVTDNSGKVFGTENVYVADASILPDSVGINPMLTTMAFSSIVADEILKV